MVSVKDDGIGLENQHINKIFDRYYRVETTQTQQISGFGIGLYLSAEIIRAHCGKIWVDSKAGQGSTFYFTLPTAVSDTIIKVLNT
jgi:signal transduction histidine kinase